MEERPSSSAARVLRSIALAQRENRHNHRVNHELIYAVVAICAATASLLRR
jgi:hypothetical protein